MKKPKKSEYVRSAVALAAALKCSPRSIRRWAVLFSDEPEADRLRSANGAYHLPTWRLLIERHGIDVSAPDPEGGLDPESLAGVRLAQERAKLRLLERKDQIEARTLMVRAEAEQAMFESHSHLKTMLRTILEDEQPPILAGLNAGAIRAEMRKVNDRLCVLMAEYGAKLKV